MIARCRILLPYTLLIKEGDKLTPHDYSDGEYKIRIHPLQRCALPLAGLTSSAEFHADELLTYLRTTIPLDFSVTIQMNDVATAEANLLQIDVMKESFDRRATLELLNRDPSPTRVFEAANSFIDRLRAVMLASWIKPVSPTSALWVVDYLQDDETPLKETPSLVRAYCGINYHGELAGVDANIWNKVHALTPDFRLSQWERLLLDAEDLMPEVGPALVLAATALETIVGTTLSLLAASSPIPARLWEWILERDGDYRKQPSVADEFDVLLEVVAGRSLKADPKLWTSFKHLREARNNFVHTGTATIGRKLVAPEQAAALVAGAREVALWVEASLPSELRSRRWLGSVEYAIPNPVRNRKS